MIIKEDFGYRFFDKNGKELLAGSGVRDFRGIKQTIIALKVTGGVPKILLTSGATYRKPENLERIM